MTTDFRIRIAEEQDFTKIYQLNQEFAQFIKTPEKFKISLEEMIDEQQYFKMLVVEKQNGEIIGFASTFIAWYSWLGKTLYLDDLYIIKDFRGLGLGSGMIKEVINLAKQQSCKKVKWQVSKWNQHAIDFYESVGADIDDVEINCELVL